MKSSKFMKRNFLVLILSFMFLSIYSQNIELKGKVTDESGEPLPGVTVVAKGTINGTVTDINGEYYLKVNSTDKILQFSFIGMKSKDVVIGSQLRIDVQLQSDFIGLDEVVAVGYGVQKKSDIISSVVSIKPESVTKIPSTDIGEMLKGKAAGVYVSLNDGGPGSSSTILIRGKNSMSGGNDPIVIADGVPVGSINDINPNDIASLEVLKDAAAQAIYGARASNGVILITTKRAEAGKAQINYNAYYGLQTVNRNFDVYSGEEFAQLKREAYRTDNNNVYGDDADVFTPTELEVLQSGKFVNWEDELLEIAAIQNHNLSISTGTEKTKVYTSYNYQNQDGVVPGTDFQKMTIRVNVDQQLNDWMNIGANTSWLLSKNNDPGTGGTLQRSITCSPLGQIYNEDGSYKLNPTGVQESFNPLLDLATVSNIKDDRNDIMNIFIDIHPLKGLKYRLNTSRRSWDRKTTGYSTAESLAGYYNGGKGVGSVRNEELTEWQVENIVSYNIEKDVHNLDFTVVQSISEKNYYSLTTDYDYVANDLLGIYGIETAETTQSEIQGYERGLVSFAGRAQYDYNGKYYVTLSARADASTVFGDNNKWGFFPAAALGWNIYKESFIENIEAISNLKLRGSYGSVGNEAISPYQSLSTAESADYIVDGDKVSGYSAGDYLPNPDLRWETSTTLNVALDYGFWRNRLSGTVEFYNTRTKDLLVKQKLNAGLGYSYMMANIGEVENQGVEFNLNGILVDNSNWKVSAGLSFTMNKNKIISLYGVDADGDGKEDDDTANSWFIGQPIDVYYQYKPVGIFQEGEDIVHSAQSDAKPGDIKLWDKNNDGEISADDDRVLTDKNPDWYGSFNLSVKYKNVDFSADVLTVQGITKNNSYLYAYDKGGSLRGVFNGIKQNYWTPENPTGNFPRPRISNDPTYMYTMGLQDASFIRLQNITLGYTLPKKLLAKLKMNNIRLYCTGHNLVTLTDFESYSPEKSADEYPEMISIVGGVQVSF